MAIHFGKPDYIYVQGTTDADGKYVLLKQNNSFFELNRNDEVCVTNLSMRNDQLFNILPGDITMQLDDSSGITTQHDIPRCKISSVRELCNHLNQLTTSITLGDKWQLLFLERDFCVFKPSNLAARRCSIPARVGFSLGLCDMEGNPSSFALLMLSHYNPVNTLSIFQNTVQNANEQQSYYLTMELDPTTNDVDFAAVRGIPVCRPLDEDIWIYISDHSFAYILLHADFISESFVGRERSRTMDLFTYDSRTSDSWVSKRPDNLQWKRVEHLKPDRLTFQLATSTGRNLPNLQFLMHIKVRKKNLF